MHLPHGAYRNLNDEPGVQTSNLEVSPRVHGTWARLQVYARPCEMSSIRHHDTQSAIRVKKYVLLLWYSLFPFKSVALTKNISDRFTGAGQFQVLPVNAFLCCVHTPQYYLSLYRTLTFYEELHRLKGLADDKQAVRFHSHVADLHAVSRIAFFCCQINFPE